MNGSLVHKCYVERFYSLEKFYSKIHNHNWLKRAIPIIILWTSYLKVYNDHKDLKIVAISMHSWEKIQKRSNVIHIYNFFFLLIYNILLIAYPIHITQRDCNFLKLGISSLWTNSNPAQISFVSWVWRAKFLSDLQL